MIGTSVEGALSTLRAEREKIDEAIATLEKLVQGGGGRASKGKAMVLAVASGRGQRGPRRRNAPRGLLIKSIREILKGQKQPMTPVDLRNALMAKGYPNKNARTLYTAIFAAAKKKDSGVKKSEAGFQLK